MVKTLLDKVGELHLNGGAIDETTHATYLQAKARYQNNAEDTYSDCDCIDCGDCDCSDCVLY